MSAMETQAASSRRIYNSRANRYDDSHHPKFSLDLLNLVTLEPGDNVLDLACGTGLGTIPAATRVGPNGYVLGVDIADGMLDEARKKIVASGYENTVELVNHSIADLPSIAQLSGREGTFDVVMCCSALVLLQDPVSAIRQWSVYLKSGSGRLLFDIMQPGTQPQYYIIELAAKALDLPMYHNVTWATGDDALFKLIDDAGGLKVEKSVFMRQREWATKHFEGTAVEGERQFEDTIRMDAFKHLQNNESHIVRELKESFVDLWCEEAHNGTVLKIGGHGMVIAVDGVWGAVCIKR